MPATALVALELPDVSGLASCSDDELSRVVRRLGEARRIVDAGIARAADEVARRSAVALGYQGLAQRSGDRTPDNLLTRLTGLSVVESRSMVTAGSLLENPEPWLAPVVARLEAGEVSIAAAAAIKNKLGEPSARVAADDLLDAAEVLAAAATELPPEKVGNLAQNLRDELDAHGVIDREQERRAKRFLKLIPQADGMTKITGLLDPESAAVVRGAIEAVTSPRRGGPRFVDSDSAIRAEELLNDPRTTEQIAVDALVQMVQISIAADRGTVFGSHKPAARIHAKLSELNSSEGSAWIEGESALVSLRTFERVVCADGAMPIIFDDRGNALNLGRAQRLFSQRQRAVLAAIWGGCAVEGCDRPPSWTEAHHVVQWILGGKTDIANGVLLCRHHHMLLHNNKWRIERTGLGELVMLPADGESTGRPMRLVSKNPLRNRS